MSDTNGSLLSRAITPIDVEEVQRWVREKLKGDANPNNWSWIERVVISLVSEIARSRRSSMERPLSSSSVSRIEGDPCVNCGSTEMMRNGSCLTCLNCGESGGCA